MVFIKKYIHLWITVAYGIFYLLAFNILEQKIIRGYHIIHTPIDDFIPFCEYFIVPYLLWFFFIAAGIIYFAFFQKDRHEYYQLIFNLGIGMTLFILISYLYPNGQDLRPTVFDHQNIFIRAVQHLYAIDTPTNIFPSIHVYNSIAICIAVVKSKSLVNYRWVHVGTKILTVSIVLSTLFLKQHSILDVICAIALNYLAYSLLYQPHKVRQKQQENIISTM